MVVSPAPEIDLTAASLETCLSQSGLGMWMCIYLVHQTIPMVSMSVTLSFDQNLAIDSGWPPASLTLTP